MWLWWDRASGATLHLVGKEEVLSHLMRASGTVVLFVGLCRGAGAAGHSGASAQCEFV